MFACVRCAQLQRTCCQRAEVLLTDEDIARLTARLGRMDFWEQRLPADAAYLAPDEGDPAWLVYTVAADGTRQMLKRREDGSCGLLGAAGCQVDAAVRPLVCRLYPWMYCEGGITGICGDYCPTTGLTAPGQTLVDALGMPEEEGERLRAQLYAELRRGRLMHANRNHL